ncbi:hypothetical protein NFI96_025162 [Prochilodus magdalenae]|nr:hypothetical protein NFI96_025162 [Prochilodus magdalenae]
MYLCKNGYVVQMEPLKDKDEYTFILESVSVQDSGLYSCAYSLNKHLSHMVRTSGYKSIQVQVTAILLVKSAVIRSGRTTVKKGEDIELTCSTSESEKPLLHVYICKDGLGKISGIVYNQTQTHFSIKDVNLEDSGVYSCVYSAEQYDISEVNDTERENSILIQVYDPQWQINLIRLLCSLGVVMFACFVVVFDVYTTKR